MKFYLVIIFLWSGILLAQEELKDKSNENKIELDQTILFESENQNTDKYLKNSVAVQRKMIQVKNKLVIFSQLATDFSDSPKKVNNLKLGLGYTPFENFEFGLTFSPLFFSSKSNSSKMIEELKLLNGNMATLDSPNPKWIVGFEGNWIFSYGKDFFGLNSILRNNSFLKFGYDKIQYAESFSGSRLGISIGKNIFLSQRYAIRFSAGISRLSYYINHQSMTTTSGIFEPGIVFYF